MSGGKLDVSWAASILGRRPSKPRGSSAHRSPSPYHHLDIFESERFDTEEPLISFDDSGNSGYPTGSLICQSATQLNSHHAQAMKGDASTPRNLIDDLDDFPRRLASKRRIPPPADTQFCVQCETHHSNLYYCNLCDVLYCGKCWDNIGPHRKGKLGPGGIPHERTDQAIADKLRATFEASPNDQEQETLFQDDENTAWFGVVKEQSGDLIFHDYGRYASVMAEISKSRGPRHSNRFPGLVCFVGETGAGKSSLIKVLIELSETDGDKYQTPVVGSIRHQDVPTSGDVHLYADPKTYLSGSPILYADCEGLAGGEREPKGAKSKLMKQMTRGSSTPALRTKSFEKNRRNLHHSSEREITWATTSEKQTREFAVTQLYPRLLYTFSDVVVFALKNPRVIENVIEKLIEWAAAALEMSSNQPVLPHAVIVLNASELSIDPGQWHVSQATKWLMDAVRGSIDKNLKFKRHAQMWRSRGKRIATVEDLLLSYYSSVRVVRVPGVGRPALMQSQMEKLYQEISSSLETSKMSKRSLRMLLDADELQPYLQFAFDHFAHNLDRAFDFVQASFVYSPIPSDFAGNILKLAVNMMELWENKLDGIGIFRELSFMVASCIMLDTARKKTRGTAERIYREYVEHCDNALEDFCDRYWPCEFVMKSESKGNAVGGRCVNVRSGHGSKGHQFKNGKVFAVGSYQSNLSVETFQDEWRFLVYDSLKELLAELREITTESLSEERAAAQIHGSKVVMHFYRHVSQGRTESLVSHSTCFVCLMESPQHALPCGHILCTSCLVAYGRTIERDVIEIKSCPLHFDIEFEHWKIYLKPGAAGVRVLTLDGGGIRGIVELEILKLIEQVWGGGLRIQDFLDLIVGTSTGGIIALGLGSMNWSVDECMSHFQTLCAEAFTRRGGMNILGVNKVLESIHHSKYETRPLQKALKETFSEDDYLFGGPRVQNSRTKVAVTATSSGSVSVLANYNRSCESKLSYTFQRPEKLSTELKIWEAARASCAIPRVFKPFFHEASKQVYADCSMYHNNPIKIADQERKLLWPAERQNYPDFILSIGTAYNPMSRKRSAEKSSTSTNFFGHPKEFATITVDQVKSSLESEKTWTDYMQELSLPQMHRDRYQRLNPALLEDPPALDDVQSIANLRLKTRRCMMADVGLHRAAYRLLVTSFYFEETEPVDNLPDGFVKCTGVIRCRLPRHALHHLGVFLSTSHERSQGPYFITRERDRAHEGEQVMISHQILSDMVIKSQWRMDPLQIKASNRLALVEIVLCIKNDEEFPISGFPRMLQGDKRMSLRKVSDSKINRWRNRTVSQIERRKKWAPYSVEPKLSHRHSKSLSSYSSPEYLVGNSSSAHLRDIRNQLGYDLTLPAETHDLSSSNDMVYEIMDNSSARELEDTEIVPAITITDSDAGSRASSIRSAGSRPSFRSSSDVEDGGALLYRFHQQSTGDDGKLPHVAEMLGRGLPATSRIPKRSRIGQNLDSEPGIASSLRKHASPLAHFAHEKPARKDLQVPIVSSDQSHESESKPEGKTHSKRPPQDPKYTHGESSKERGKPVQQTALEQLRIERAVLMPDNDAVSLSRMPEVHKYHPQGDGGRASEGGWI